MRILRSRFCLPGAAAGGLLLAILSGVDALAAQKWLRCTLTERGWEGPWTAISPPRTRLFTFDDQSGSFGEYANGELVPSETTPNISPSRIMGRVNSNGVVINRVTGQITVTISPTGVVVDSERGTCAETAPISVPRRKF